MISTSARAVLTAVVVGLVLILFAAAFTYAIVQVWLAEDAHPPTYNEALLYVATGLVTLVGGVIAVLFNVQQPLPTQAIDIGSPSQGPLDKSHQRIKILHALLQRLPQLPNYLGIAYVIVYLCVGTAAVVTWLARPDATSDLVKNVATTFVGLAILVVGGFFDLRAAGAQAR